MHVGNDLHRRYGGRIKLGGLIGAHVRNDYGFLSFFAVVCWRVTEAGAPVHDAIRALHP